MICPTCGSDNTTWDAEGLYECNDCTFWFDPDDVDVKSDQWLIEHDEEPIWDENVIYGFQSNRDRLRELLVKRQDDICIMCGYGMYGDSAVHEAIIKRGDLPGEERIFVQPNCVCLHQKCHRNTKEADKVCLQYLIETYTLPVLADWIRSLEMEELPARAREVVLADESVTDVTG